MNDIRGLLGADRVRQPELRPIGRADIEFHEPLLVLRTAQAGLRHGQDWDRLGYRARQRRLDAAMTTLQVLLNQPDCAARLVASIIARGSGRTAG